MVRGDEMAADREREGRRAPRLDLTLGPTRLMLGSPACRAVDIYGTVQTRYTVAYRSRGRRMARQDHPQDHHHERTWEPDRLHRDDAPTGQAGGNR